MFNKCSAQVQKGNKAFVQNAVRIYPDRIKKKWSENV